MKKNSKLRIHRETLRSLEAGHLGQAVGQASGRSDCICPVTTIGPIQCITVVHSNCPFLTNCTG